MAALTAPELALDRTLAALLAADRRVMSRAFAHLAAPVPFPGSPVRSAGASTPPSRSPGPFTGPELLLLASLAFALTMLGLRVATMAL